MRVSDLLREAAPDKQLYQFAGSLHVAVDSAKANIKRDLEALQAQIDKRVKVPRVKAELEKQLKPIVKALKDLEKLSSNAGKLSDYLSDYVARMRKHGLDI